MSEGARCRQWKAVQVEDKPLQKSFFEIFHELHYLRLANKTPLRSNPAQHQWKREKKKKRQRTGALQNEQHFQFSCPYTAIDAPPVMNNTPQTTLCVACLWAWGRNYRVLTFPLLFGMQKYKENSCKVCTHRRAYYTNSVSFFLFERLWKLTPPLLSSPTTENLRMYRMMSEKK